MSRSFPKDNVSLSEFQAFLIEHPSMKVLIDIKDVTTLPYLEEFVVRVGKERCLAHAFIKNWTIIPSGVSEEPHWYREDIDLFVLDLVLSRLGVPLIANCRGFSDAHVEKHALIEKMIEDSEKCKSVISLGLYYPGVPLPKVEFLNTIYTSGYYPWVNGNLPYFPTESIAMSDALERCTHF